MCGLIQELIFSDMVYRRKRKATSVPVPQELEKSIAHANSFGEPVDPALLALGTNEFVFTRFCYSINCFFISFYIYI